MLRLLLLLLAAAPPVFTVTGTAQREHRTTPCMGGVRVTEDLVTIESTTLARQDFTVFAGADRKGRVAARFKTDSRGSFTTSLPAGAWCVVLGKHEPTQEQPLPESQPSAPVRSPHLDAECLARLAHPEPGCDAQWTVTDRPLTGVRLTLHSSNSCPQPWANPCWRGPLPP